MIMMMTLTTPTGFLQLSSSSKDSKVSDYIMSTTSVSQVLRLYASASYCYYDDDRLQQPNGGNFEDFTL